jgi:hypothetical protein
MLQDGQNIAFNQNLVDDLYAYVSSNGNMNEFNAYVDNNYDSSGDYWKLTGDGNIIFDGSKNLYDKDGNLLVEYKGDGGYTASLASVLGVDFDVADAMLKNAGLTYMDGTFKRGGVDAKNNSSIIIQTSDEIKTRFLPGQVEPVVEPVSLQNEKQTGFFQGIAEGIGNTWNSLKNNLSKIPEKINNGIDRLKKKVSSFFRDTREETFSTVEEEVMPELNDTTGGLVMYPGEDSLAFWEGIMTQETKEKYAKTSNGATYCSTFFRDVVREQFGNDVYSSIFDSEWDNTNALFEKFKTNPNLEKIDTNVTGVRAIQEMADSGVLVFMIYKNPDPAKSGHIAFVGNSNLILSTTSPIANFEGKKGSGLNPDKYWPILAQAGEYTGTTTMVYGTNGWNHVDDDGNPVRDTLLASNLYFYIVRDE